jgi:NADPH:quinone reductase-like Zn-dependent oxidoreductase
MAEFVTANTKNTGFKPKLIRFEEAAALPLAGVSALQALEEHIQIHQGQKILIHGGAGGVGHFAIQIAKAHDVYVATTVKTEDVKFVKSLGADEVINYETHHFEERLKNFDAVFDTVGGEITNKSFQVLKKAGIIVSMVGEPNQELAKTAGVTAIGQMTKTTSEHLKRLTELVESGRVIAQVDKIFALEQTADAFIYQEKIHPNGKVVVTIR